MKRIRLAILLLAATVPAVVTVEASALELEAGSGETLVVERDPFQLSLVDRHGETTVATVPGLEGAPVRVPGIDGPLPIEPLGQLGGFPAMAFVVGVAPSQSFPASFFQGNRLFGGEVGVLVSLVEVTDVVSKRRGLNLEVRTDAPSVGPALLRVRRLSGGGVRLELEPPGGLTPIGTQFTLESPSEEGLYGLGGRKDSFDQRGLLRNVWTEQQNATSADGQVITGSDPTRTTGPEYTFPNGAQAAYYVQAALHGSRGWTAWVDQSELSRLDLAASRTDAIRWGVAASELTLSLAGGGLERSARSYTARAGRAPAPPRYAYEPWIDVINEGEGEAAPNGQGFTGGERVKADLKEIVRRSRELRIPIGTLGIEGWQSVPGKGRFLPRLRRKGFRLSGYWNMFTSPSSKAYDEALAKDLFVKDSSGEPYPIVTNRGGLSYLIDFSHPEAKGFWRKQIARSSRLGLEGFMEDFGELVTEGMQFANGESALEMHNHYPVLYHRAGRSAVRKFARRSGTRGVYRERRYRPFFYVRAGFGPVDGTKGVIGSSPSVFPGDETTDFAEGSGLPSVPPAMLNLAMGGSYAFTTDVGGYLDLVAPATSKELFIRWSQLASFTAINRIHNSTMNGSRYPWDFDRQAIRVYRRYAKAKVRLIPMIDRLAKRASRSGKIGPVRPLVLDDASPEARSIDDEWTLGRRILVAPVIDEGARERDVYLPRFSDWRQARVTRKGKLRRFGPRLDGGSTVTAPAPLRDIPIFVRAR
ncbi:MAG: hypothetical protein M3331_00165 [Actinomycetota bacterium]|nr:hypothetical protein [Actinomycetota bacterium]